MRQCVAVLGGGIRGTAIAALLAQSQTCEVILLERDRIGSGTTSTNHGRLHSGASLWQEGLDSLVHRHRTGSKLIRQLPGVLEEQEQGIYFVPEDTPFFETELERLQIPYRRLRSWKFINSFMQGDRFAAAYEVPEYHFNPARLAGKFAAYAESLGAAISTKSAIYAIEAGTGQQFCICLANGSKIKAHFIVNVLGSWSNQIHSELPLPHLNLEWHQWRILCLLPEIPSATPPNRVIAIADKNTLPTAVPHKPWITFSCRKTPEKVPVPIEMSGGEWRRFDKNDEFDAVLFEISAQHFLPLQSSSAQQRLFSFSGVYPSFEMCRERPYSLLHSEQVPNYYIVYGENATTALLDATETAEVILQRLDPSRFWIAGTYLAEKLSTRFTHKVHPDTAEMIWEKRVDYAAANFR
jgi:hypothetical protein